MTSPEIRGIIEKNLRPTPAFDKKAERHYFRLVDAISFVYAPVTMEPRVRVWAR